MAADKPKEQVMEVQHGATSSLGCHQPQFSNHARTCLGTATATALLRAEAAPGALDLPQNPCPMLEEEVAEADDDDGDGDVGPADADGNELPEGDGRSLIVIGGHSGIDDALAAMAAQVMEVQGATAGHQPHTTLSSSGAGALDLNGVDTVVISYLNPSSPAWARQAVRRLKRRSRSLRVGLLVPSFQGGHETFTAESVNADFVVSRISEAVVRGFADEKPVALKRAAATLTRQRARGKTRKTSSVKTKAKT
jgi:hypothetical protein